jgi:hypothetical protein
MLGSIFNSVLNEASIAPYAATAKEFIASLGVIFPIAIIALCLFVGLFGRRISGLVRFLLLFAIGFFAAVHFVCPVISGVFPAVPGYAVGLAAGLLAAVLSKLIYNVAYIGVVGFAVYKICFDAMLFEQLTAMTKGDMNVSLAVAAAAVIIALILRKYLEMFITSLLGGLGVAFFVNNFFDYASRINLTNETVIVLAGLILMVPMFLYQLRHRRFF